MTDAVEEIVGLGLRNPVRIVVNLKDKRAGEIVKERRTPTGLENTYLICRQAEKTLQLIRLLQFEAVKHESAKYIIYFSTCAAVDYFYRILSRLSSMSTYHFTSLHGDLPPRIRATALATFIAHPSTHLQPSVLLCTDVAARGVDFEDVDVVIQYDTPTDPKTFSHRAGRTARAGRRGKAVVLLSKGREEDYIDFLGVRKIPLTQQKYIAADLEEIDLPEHLDSSSLDLMKDIRKIVVTDRELADKAAKSFVSALRAYSKHEASFIFRMADVNYFQMGIAYGLLRLPAMPEIKEWKRKRGSAQRKRETGDQGEKIDEDEQVGWQDAEVDWDTFAYASKTRETARLASLETKKTDSIENKKKRKIQAEMREAWSDKKDGKARKEERRSKKDMKKKAEWEKEQAEGNGKEIGFAEAFKIAREKEKAKAQSKKQDSDSDGEGLDLDYRSLKREIKEERIAKKAKKNEEKEGLDAGSMFDDLE
ncbi:hypothetical protein P7C73_g2049, partial [Tremellales sp. Uapishka_1]